MKSRTVLAIAALALPVTALVAPALTGMEEHPTWRAPSVMVAGHASTGADSGWDRGRALAPGSDEAVAMPAAGGWLSAPPDASRLLATSMAGDAGGTSLSFSSRVLLETDFYTRATEVAIGDVTGDGRNDVVVLVYSSDPNKIPVKIHLFRQGADGTLQAPVDVASVYSAVDWRDIALGDIDDDGRDDIVIATGGGIVAYRPRPDGTFAYSYSYGISKPSHIQLMDVDRDGRLDAVTRNSYGHIFLGDGHGSFPDEVQWLALQGGLDFQLGDVDSDHRLDVVAPDGNYFLDVLTGDLLSASATKYPLDVSVGQVLVAIGDFNGDGRGDVAASNLHDDPVRGYVSGLQLLHQDATRTLAPPVRIPLEVEALSMVAADLDTDGLEDLVLLHGLYPMRIGWMRQDSDGLEPLAPIGDGVDGAADPDAIAVGNVDGDRCPDVVAVFGSSVVLYSGSGCRSPRIMAVCRTQQPVSSMQAPASSIDSGTMAMQGAVAPERRQGVVR